jgi:transcriptional regulator with XRE-family HTH domain
VSRWLSGETRPGSRRLARLAGLLKVPTDEVIAALEADDGTKLPVEPRSPSLEDEVAELRARVDELEKAQGVAVSRARQPRGR